jgi:hypothetical protein
MLVAMQNTAVRFLARGGGVERVAQQPQLPLVLRISLPRSDLNSIDKATFQM